MDITGFGLVGSIPVPDAATGQKYMPQVPCCCGSQGRQLGPALRDQGAELQLASCLPAHIPHATGPHERDSINPRNRKETMMDADMHHNQTA